MGDVRWEHTTPVSYTKVSCENQVDGAISQIYLGLVTLGRGIIPPWKGHANAWEGRRKVVIGGNNSQTYDHSWSRRECITKLQQRISFYR